MSDNNSKGTSRSQNDHQEATKDWQLQAFVEMVNTSGVAFGMTLLTHGFLVSGKLIGGKEYFELLGKNLSDAFDNSEKVFERFKETGEEIYSTENTKKGSPSYIHMKNARFYDANGNFLPTDGGSVWRGRISEISGFVVGSFSSTD